MSSLRAALPAILLAGAPSASGAAEPAYPPDALILFVASWCAPCRAELARLDAIAASAAPREVLVVPIDRSAATAAMLRGVPPSRIWRSARAVAGFTQEHGSLPFSVMTDTQGSACAAHDRGLTTVTVADMRRRCEGGT